MLIKENGTEKRGSGQALWHTLFPSVHYWLGFQEPTVEQKKASDKKNVWNIKYLYKFWK